MFINGECQHAADWHLIENIEDDMSSSLEFDGKSEQSAACHCCVDELKLLMRRPFIHQLTIICEDSRSYFDPFENVCKNGFNEEIRDLFVNIQMDSHL